jgi:hypothetical protein
VDQYDAVGLDPKIRTPGFIKDFIDVAGPFEELRARICGDAQWIAPLATAATSTALLSYSGGNETAKQR